MKKRTVKQQLIIVHLCFALCLMLGSTSFAKPFKITVVDVANKQPVCLVHLTTTDEQLFVTDNAGVVAIDQPDLLGKETWFTVSSPGYEIKADGFGMRGFRTTPKLDQELQIEISRTSISERIGRLTGGGLLAESSKWQHVTEANPHQIVGCDSVQMVRYQKKLFWLWGDTTLRHYPLGIFHSSAAMTEPHWDLKRPLQPKYQYFQSSEKKVKGVAPMPGKGPTWITGITVIADSDGKEKLVATYTKIENFLDVYEYGQCVWDELKEEFTPHQVLWNKHRTKEPPPKVLEGHVVYWQDEKKQKWILFGNPLPTMRCKATFADWSTPATWEQIEVPKSLKDEKEMKVIPHSGSIAWNPHRECWVTVFMEKFGRPSAFGELWYAEAESPFGPWGNAVKILSHQNYTFYNPRVHAELSHGQYLYFEGTYTQQFANKPRPTPRYDYNQVLYRLDLNDPRIKTAQVTRNGK
ncbi:MAG: hypothetical protein R3B84_08775 [Zavarzinella sp.]